MGFELFVGMAHFNISQFLTPLWTTFVNHLPKKNVLQVNDSSWMGDADTRSWKVIFWKLHNQQSREKSFSGIFSSLTFLSSAWWFCHPITFPACSLVTGFWSSSVTCRETSVSTVKSVIPSPFNNLKCFRYCNSLVLPRWPVLGRIRKPPCSCKCRRFFIHLMHLILY